MMDPRKIDWPEYKAGELMPGTQCAAIQKIGQGGQAEVYVVRELYLEKVKVMKLWCSQFFTEQSFRDFRAEAIKQAAMAHDNIVSVSSGGMTQETNRRPYFLMDYHEGETLDRVLRRMRAKEMLLRDDHIEKVKKGIASTYQPTWVTVRDAAQICIQVCAALTHAHVKHGLLHRDVKLANILIVPDGWDQASVKLLDFGIAKLIEQALLNPDAGFYGTLSNCAPEQIGGKSVVQSDIYAVAGVFYELLCGVRVFAEATSTPELLRAVLHQKPVPISKRMGNVTPRLEEFFQKNLAKNPDVREASARELAKAIKAIADEYEALDARPKVESQTDHEVTDRMPFQAALAMTSGPSEEHVARAKLDSVWDSATGAAMPVVHEDAASDVVGPRLYRARAVSTDPMNVEIVAKAVAVEAELRARQEARDAAPLVLLGPHSQAGQRRPSAITVPFGSSAGRAVSDAARAAVKKAELEAEASTAPRDVQAKRSNGTPQTHDNPRAGQSPVQAKAESQRPAPREAAKQAPAAPTPIEPPARGAKMGDTDPSRVEPWDGALRDVVSVKVVNPAPRATPDSTPPPTQRLSADSQKAATDEWFAHMAAKRPGMGNTTPMANAPGQVPAAKPKASAYGTRTNVAIGVLIGVAFLIVIAALWMVYAARSQASHVELPAAPLVTMPAPSTEGTAPELAAAPTELPPAPASSASVSPSAKVAPLAPAKPSSASTPKKPSPSGPRLIQVPKAGAKAVRGESPNIVPEF